ncbi:glycosyltransferase family 4 protein, partial [Candidatus Peregrinibacteria bacterium]|nr:glycosyltransferase family 4 protein [Candidatus Peregrinibacteria bacterium]
YKGVEVLVRAMRLLPKEIKLDLVGDGEEEANLRKIADERVTFHGFKNRNEVAEYYKKASLLIHPTLDPEPFGLIIVEGMNFGLPSVSSQGSGSAWVAGDSGLTFKAGDVKDLSAKILMIYNDAALRKNLREKAKERVKYFDYKNWLPKLEEVLKKI